MTQEVFSRVYRTLSPFVFYGRILVLFGAKGVQKTAGLLGERCRCRTGYFLLSVCNRMFRPRPLSAQSLSYESFYESQAAEDFFVLCKEIGISREWFAGKKLLEVGSGLGKLCHAVLSSGAEEVVAIDIDTNALAFAAEKADLLGLKGGRFESRTVHDTGLPDNYFDVAYSHTVFEHLDDVPSALQEIHRVLKPGGRLIFTHHAFKSRHGPHLSTFVIVPWPTTFFPEDVLTKFWHDQRERFVRHNQLDEIPPLLAFDKGLGCLNRLEIRELETILIDSPFEIVDQASYGHEEWLLERFPSLQSKPDLFEFLRGSVIVMLGKRP